tara:strand:- start:29 stop:343 length:315 start_codon:yes stop_codon:yes gene_type:complete
MSTPVLIYVTVHTEENAKLIANAIVREKAAAAVQTSSTNSTYWWKGEIVTRTEFVLTVKTVESYYNSVRDIVDNLHTYAVPVMEMFEINKLEPSHLQWLQDSLA